jgi:hexosaminidase
MAESPRYTAPLRLPVTATPTTVTALVLLPGGRASPPRSARVSRATMRPATTPPAEGLQPGLVVAYYERAFGSAAAIEPLPPTRTAVADRVALQGFERPVSFGLRFDGFVRVPADGITPSRFPQTTAASSASGISGRGQRRLAFGERPHGTDRARGGIHPVEIRFVAAALPP